MVHSPLSIAHRLFKLLNPRPPIGGLEISETDLKFVQFKDGKVISSSLRLPAGIIEAGKVKDAENLKKSLIQLHLQVAKKKKKKLFCIVSIPDRNVYTQVFGIPYLPEKAVKEAAELNLQMISPINYGDAYTDWQKVGEGVGNGDQIEILGAFIQKETVNEFIRLLNEANFSVAAVEFPSLSLARLARSGLPSPISAQKNHTNHSLILLRVASDGLNYSITRGSNLYFHHSSNWEDARVSMADLEDIIVRETQRVLNFHAGHWQNSASKMTLLVPNPVLEEKIQEMVTNNFSLEVIPFRSLLPPNIYGLNPASFPSDWFVVLGAAIRGMTPRSKDTIISLAAIGTEEEFRRAKIMNFARIWRNTVMTVAAFIIVIFAAFEGFLLGLETSFESRLANISIPGGNEEFERLEKEARDFNQKIELALGIRRQTIDWVPFFEKMNELAGENVFIDRIFLQGPGRPVLVTARADSESAIVNFKNTLARQPQLENVDLPLASIIPSATGISFNLSFIIKNTEF